MQGDRLQNAGPGEPVEVWVYSAFPKENWIARKSGDVTHAEYPGTAIEIGNDLFEIVTAEVTAEPGYMIRYGLRKWDPQHAVRKAIPYTPETQAQSAAEYRQEEKNKKLQSGIFWLFPLAGMAPDPVLREWEKKAGLNMTVVAAGSAVAEVCLFLALMRVPSGSTAGAILHPVGLYLGIEGLVRLAWILLTLRPHGSFALAVPYILWQVMTQPVQRRQNLKGLKFTYDPDEVIRGVGTNRLVIRSMLFDDFLAGPSPVRIEDAVYKPLSWRVEGKGLSRRLVYELEKTVADPGGTYREYTHPRAPERQKAVEALTRSRDHVQMFTLLWGTYPRKEQLRLEVKYQFAATRWTAITAGFLLVCALLQIGVSALLHTTIFALAGPVYFIFESFYRLYASKVLGVPAGSLAGYILGRFFRPPA